MSNLIAILGGFGIGFLFLALVLGSIPFAIVGGVLLTASLVVNP